MAGKVLNIKVSSTFKQRIDLTGNYHAICHYSYNLPLGIISYSKMTIRKGHLINTNLDELEQKIFRIIPFERFIELMTSKNLSFVRPALWDDPFENFIMNSHSDCDSIKTAIYGQCWSLNIETDFMWRVYAPNKNGIKLHTSIKKFMNHLLEKNSFLENCLIFIGKVEYLPWNKTKEKFDGISLYDSYFSKGNIKNIPT